MNMRRRQMAAATIACQALPHHRPGAGRGILRVRTPPDGARREFLGPFRFGLDHWVNTALSYASVALFLVSPWLFGRTPLEVLSPGLDRRVSNLLLPKPLACHACGRGANETCDVCGRPACPRHGRVTRRFTVTCTTCAAAAGPDRA